MTRLLELTADSLRDTVLAVLPIAALLVVIQAGVLRRPLPHLRRTVVGFGYVVLGMSLFLAGLGEALFPLGRLMAGQLTAPEFIGLDPGASGTWMDYRWVYVFGAAIGFATTVAEPALIAVSLKAEEVSGGTIGAWGLRISVAIGVAIGIAVGCFRIVTGTPLPAYIIVGYVFVLIQATRAPRAIIALAFDEGGVTTSTVRRLPRVGPAGGGAIAFASLFPMMTVMGFAQVAQWRARRHQLPATKEA